MAAKAKDDLDYQWTQQVNPKGLARMLEAADNEKGKEPTEALRRLMSQPQPKSR